MTHSRPRVNVPYAKQEQKFHKAARPVRPRDALTRFRSALCKSHLVSTH